VERNDGAKGKELIEEALRQNPGFACRTTTSGARKCRSETTLSQPTIFAGHQDETKP